MQGDKSGNPIISRVENGHTIPSLETLERFAAALDIPLCRFFYTGEDLPSTPNLTPRAALAQMAEEGDKDGASARFVLKLKKYADKIVESDPEVLLTMAKRFAPLCLLRPICNTSLDKAICTVAAGCTPSLRCR